MSKILVHTPDGVRDIYGNECGERKLIANKIHSKVKSFGYEDIETPTFEYFDVFAEEINTSDAKQLFKFFDSEGNTLVLRPDFTPSIARCASKVMLDDGKPIRVCYEGSAFLNTSSLQGKLKENCNIGVELMNEPSVYADAEMIALLIESLKATGLNEFQVSIGDADYYKGICEEAGISAETEEQIREQIIGKNYFAAENIMNEKEDKSINYGKDFGTGYMLQLYIYENMVYCECPNCGVSLRIDECDTTLDHFIKFCSIDNLHYTLPPESIILYLFPEIKRNASTRSRYCRRCDKSRLSADRRHLFPQKAC